MSVTGRICARGHKRCPWGVRGAVPYGWEDVVGCDGGEGLPSVGSQGNHVAERRAARERRVDISWGAGSRVREPRLREALRNPSQNMGSKVCEDSSDSLMAWSTEE